MSWRNVSLNNFTLHLQKLSFIFREKETQIKKKKKSKRYGKSGPKAMLQAWNRRLTFGPGPEIQPIAENHYPLRKLFTNIP